MNALRGTVFAGNATLGLANLFNPRDRDGNNQIDEIDLTLPISERFFSGGSTTLRGFNFEEAGPRQAIIPVGPFVDQNKETVILNPFTVPVGGNALAIVNLEARIPFTRALQVVPFYDGGNVFRRVGDLFGKHDKTPVFRRAMCWRRSTQPTCALTGPTRSASASEFKRRWAARWLWTMDSC